MDFLAFGAAVLTIDPWSLRLIGRIRKDLRPLFQPRATRANGRPDRGWIHTVVALSHLPDRFQAVLSASVTMVALALIGDALGIADAGRSGWRRCLSTARVVLLYLRHRSEARRSTQTGTEY